MCVFFFLSHCIRYPDEIDELLIGELPEISTLGLRADGDDKSNREEDVWILKPSIMNQGNEIHIIDHVDKFREVLSRCVSGPALLSNVHATYSHTHIDITHNNTTLPSIS